MYQVDNTQKISTNETHTMFILENPSLCIPRIDRSVEYHDIFKVFQNIKLGYIRNIDIVYNHKTQSKRAYIHFSNWFTNPRALSIKEKILKNETMKVVHTFPEYWKFMKSKSA